MHRIERAAGLLSKHHAPWSAESAACVGILEGQQVRQLRNCPHCVVATPGRLNDFLQSPSLRDPSLTWISTLFCMQTYAYGNVPFFTVHSTSLGSSHPCSDRELSINQCEYLVLDEGEHSKTCDGFAACAA